MVVERRADTSATTRQRYRPAGDRSRFRIRSQQAIAWSADAGHDGEFASLSTGFVSFLRRCLMRDTDDRDDDLDFGQFVGQRRAQPERVGNTPQFKRKKPSRTGSVPTSYNGMHRRRKKRVMW
jgi:hypothetical protein